MNFSRTRNAQLSALSSVGKRKKIASTQFGTLRGLRNNRGVAESQGIVSDEGRLTGVFYVSPLARDPAFQGFESLLVKD